MPPTPPSTASSAGQSPPDPQFRVVRKRNRVPLSCAPCRHRKLKCNRSHPCDNCVKRGDTGSCTYAAPGSRKKSSSSAGSNASPDDMQSRIDRLEGLVISLMNNGPQGVGPAAAQAAIANSVNGSSDGPRNSVSDGPESIMEEEGEESEVEQVAKSIGVMKMDNNRTMFASEAHWFAILGEISEVKNYFNDHKKQFEDQYKKYKATQPQEPSPGTAFLFGAQQPTSEAELRARFPPKSTADLLVTRYFNTYDPGIHIIHGPTFQKQYDRHWGNPNESPIIWLGLVYAMMCIALQSYSRAGDEPPEYKGKSWEMSSVYRNLTAQCLIAADITQPLEHMLETLVLHVFADYDRSRDAETGIMVSTGIIVRLAMRMGLHRDSKPYPTISVFRGEMRRRVWAAIRSLDLLFSAQAGLPPITRPRDTNTEIPRNIYDDELYEGMEVLPPSRPETEVTPTLFLINRTRLLYKLGEARELVESLTCTDYEDVLKLDAQAKALHDSISPSLRMRSVDESARDPSTLIMQRFTLELLYLKIVMVLHRKYLVASRCHPRYSHSRKVAIEACLAMLQHQATLHRECQPGGRLRCVKWFISSLTTVDFLMAAMMVASDLYHALRSECQGRRASGDAAFWSNDRHREMLDALETAVVIWDSLKEHSMEAYKAYTTLSVMLTQIKQHRGVTEGQRNFSTVTGPPPYPTPQVMDDNVAPEHTAAMTLGMLSTGGMTPNSANMFDTTRYPPSMANVMNDGTVQPPISSSQTGNVDHNPFSNLFGGAMGFQNMELPSFDSSNLDWGAFDNFIGGPNVNLDSALQYSFPMDTSIAPSDDLQVGGLPTTQPAAASQLNPQANAFAGAGEGGVFMGAPQDSKTYIPEGYTMGFPLPKQT
ncbi:hypothetical protein M011DRAFT_492363 [Sporormia fimetaria CBS 119925]|uniref:Zn(2)-C6 fungal-type domain-containing protein n=1 Tax=Sporormia fimetaria CBS 119925 TaxID=1340428 RepID=A0A6A6VKA2_9PLEO|nr:hypothetical protein M011DRAFT_492363 [Sporormia fimetaria CBS 119925]